MGMSNPWVDWRVSLQVGLTQHIRLDFGIHVDLSESKPAVKMVQVNPCRELTKTSRTYLWMAHSLTHLGGFCCGSFVFPNVDQHPGFDPQSIDAGANTTLRLF